MDDLGHAARSGAALPGCNAVKRAGVRAAFRQGLKAHPAGSDARVPRKDQTFDDAFPKPVNNVPGVVRNPAINFSIVVHDFLVFPTAHASPTSAREQHFGQARRRNFRCL
ncbi:MAG: hypothetical protein M3Z75_13825 [Actinomycetota bacterium]|nr:hypothetical protein [Actinomycetota bacterium]